MTFMLANIIQDTLQPLISVFQSVLVFFHDSLGLSWGWSIIALTVTVRTILIPLTYKQIKSTQSLQEHAPELKKLQERYKDDPEKRNQEMMKFYKENKVNPFGSCLPLVFQMPVFISLFYMLRTDLKEDICPGIKEYAATHGHDLSTYSCTQYANTKPTPASAPFDDGFFFIPDITAKATGAVLVALIVLYIGSQLASSMIMSVTADRNQRLLMMGLPFVFTIFIINFPAGLLLYWITTNLWTVGQATVVRRMRLRTIAEQKAKEDAEWEAAGAVGIRPSEREPEPQEKKTFLQSFGIDKEAFSSAAVAKDKKGGAAAKPAAKSKAKPSSSNGAPAAPPPRPPRQKKKRSGRRR